MSRRRSRSFSASSSRCAGDLFIRPVSAWDRPPSIPPSRPRSVPLRGLLHHLPAVLSATAGGAQRVRKIFFFGQVAEGGSSVSMTSGSKAGCIVRWAADGQTGRMGIRRRSGKLQAGLTVVANTATALGAVSPSDAKLIPAHLRDRRGVRALCVGQNLFVKGHFVVIAGRAEKARPALIAAGNALHGLVIQLCDKLKFCGKAGTSYLSWLRPLFTASRSFFCFFGPLQMASADSNKYKTDSLLDRRTADPYTYCFVFAMKA